MNISYLIYEAERPKTVAEQRAADIQSGQFAASVARLGRSVKDVVVRAADMRRTGGHAPELTAEAAEAAVQDGGMSIAELERLYSVPCARTPLDSNGADGGCTVRSS
jgi:hypothetical protein